MKNLVISLFVLVGLSGFAHAEGDAEAGKTKAAACAGCHGADGNSGVASFPKLAGQNVKYLLKQMGDIKSGARSVPAMMGQLDGKSEQEMQDIAAYFSSQYPTVGAAKKELVELGEKIYRAGSKDSGVSACTACHSPTGKGNSMAGFPALSGQHADYIATQLRAFREGERTNDGDSKMMRSVAFRLTNKEIDAVSSYISGLH
ncbi:MAG: c-type cytochrome [Pseudomonadales bacterium]